MSYEPEALVHGPFGVVPESYAIPPAGDGCLLLSLVFFAPIGPLSAAWLRAEQKTVA